METVAAMVTRAAMVTLAVVKLRKRRIDFLRAGSPKSSTPQSIIWIRLHSAVNPVETLLRPHAALVGSEIVRFTRNDPCVTRSWSIGSGITNNG